MQRKEAMSLGLKQYYNGRSCPHGHSANRYVSTGLCIICAANNKKSWQKSNPGKIKEYSKEYYRKNKKNILTRFKAWVKDNPDKMRELNKKWHINNPEGRRIHEGRRRSIKKGSGDNYTTKQLTDLRIAQDNLCVYCFVCVKSKYHIDHIDPLSLGGSNGIENIQILCPTCNMQKHNKTHEEFFNLKQGN